MRMIISYLTDPKKRSRLIDFFKVSLSHHPHCDPYNNHIVLIKGVKVCKGCIVLYPSAYFVLIAIWFVPAEFYEQKINILFLIHILFGLPAIIHAFKIDKIFRIQRQFSLFSRLSLGIGFGAATRFIWIAPVSYKVYMILTIIILYGLLMLNRLKGFWNECKGCLYESERKNTNMCIGLAPIYYIMNEPILKLQGTNIANKPL